MTVNKVVFLQVWPKYFITSMAILEFLATIILILTELGNVGASFWITNVFAGGWCGLVMMVHFVALFMAGYCSPGPSSAFHAVIITVIALLATGCLIGFDAAFVAQPSTCILTSSCSSNAAQTNTFSYNFQQSFFTTFNGLGSFKTYTQTQTKFLFQVIQLAVGTLCFVLCLIYLIVYYVCRSEAKKRLATSLIKKKQDADQSEDQNPHAISYWGSNSPVPQVKPRYSPWHTREDL